MSTIKFVGNKDVVNIGGHWLEPGDDVCDDPKTKTEIFCDTESLRRLARRSDFEGFVSVDVTTKKAELPPSDFEEDLSDG